MKPDNRSGTTIVEAAVALAIVAVFFGGLFGMAGTNQRFFRSSRETIAATHQLQERMEQVRNGKWDEITSAAWIKTVLTRTPLTGGDLPTRAEQITISAYPPPRRQPRPSSSRGTLAEA